MMRIVPIAAAVMALTLCSSAQDKPFPKVAPLTSRIMVNGCPGLMSAKHTGVSHELWTISMEDQKTGADDKTGLGVSVSLELADTGLMKNQTIREAVISVSYLPAGLRRMTTAPEELATKTFTVRTDSSAKLNADLLVGKAASVKKVHLVSLTYGDGTTWKSMSEAACSVTPSRYLPVDAR